MFHHYMLMGPESSSQDPLGPRAVGRGEHKPTPWPTPALHGPRHGLQSSHRAPTEASHGAPGCRCNDRHYNCSSLSSTLISGSFLQRLNTPNSEGSAVATRIILIVQMRKPRLPISPKSRTINAFITMRRSFFRLFSSQLICHPSPSDSRSG